MAPNVGKVTFLLAEMQTRINAAGLRSFEGDVDRFAIFSLIVRDHKKEEDEAQAEPATDQPRLGHVILVGYGRVGKLIAKRLAERHVQFVVIEGDPERVEEADEAGLSVRPFGDEGLRITIGEPEANTRLIEVAARWSQQA